MPLSRTGQKLLIEHKVPDKNSGLFVRARLFDELGIELASSPVSLIHKADGLYRDSSLSMPNTQYVTVITAIFFDAGFTNSADEDYTDGVDVFERVDDLIKTNVVIPRSDEIVIEIESMDMEVLFGEEDIMDIYFGTDEIFVEIDGEEIEVVFDDSDISAEINC